MMNQNLFFVQILCVISLLVAAILGYQAYHLSQQLLLAQIEIDRLTQRTLSLEAEQIELVSASDSDSKKLSTELVDKQNQIVKMQQQNANLSAQLLKAQANVETYKLRYQSQKNASERAREDMQKRLQRELDQLAEQNAQELANQRSELEGTLASATQKKATEARVDKLMTKFTALKVDLNVLNSCNQDYLDRYGEAKSLLNHMTTYIRKHELNDDYYYFVIANDAQLVRKNREICIEN